jgi:phosphoglucomutase
MTVSFDTNAVFDGIDLNGTELILDADADTSITADTDDTIHFKIGGNDRITLSTGLIDIKNDGTQSAIRLYCESSNAHYTALQSAAHSAYSGNVT